MDVKMIQVALETWRKLMEIKTRTGEPFDTIIRRMAEERLKDENNPHSGSVAPRADAD